jgi:hypothetical protein
VPTQYGGQAGDIYLYSRDDQQGSFARRGGNTNFGYSGYFLASIFDGGEWRKLQFNRLVPYNDRSFSLAREKPRVVAYLEGVVRSWRGRATIYIESSRSFTIPGMEIPE